MKNKLLQKLLEKILGKMIINKQQKLNELTQLSEPYTHPCYIHTSQELDEYMILLQRIKLNKSCSCKRLLQLLFSELFGQECENCILNMTNVNQGIFSYSFLVHLPKTEK